MSRLKKGMVMVLITVFTMMVLACKNDETSITTMSEILEADGYALETSDKDSRDYYAQQLKNLYDLDVSCKTYISGYVDSSDSGRYVRLLEFGSESEAQAFVSALEADDVDLLLVRRGAIVVYTYSQETVALFQ